MTATFLSSCPRGPLHSLSQLKFPWPQRVGTHKVGSLGLSFQHPLGPKKTHAFGPHQMLGVCVAVWLCSPSSPCHFRCSASPPPSQGPNAKRVPAPPSPPIKAPAQCSRKAMDFCSSAPRSRGGGGVGRVRHRHPPSQRSVLLQPVGVGSGSPGKHSSTFSHPRLDYSLFLLMISCKLPPLPGGLACGAGGLRMAGPAQHLRTSPVGMLDLEITYFLLFPERAPTTPDILRNRGTSLRYGTRPLLPSPLNLPEFPFLPPSS